MSIDRRRALALTLAVAAIAALAGCDRDDEPSAKSSDAKLRQIAADHAERALGVKRSDEPITIVRSKRDPAWALAAGTSGRKLWAIWLRDGSVRIATTGVKDFNPPVVPCDLRPAFSEPSADC